MSFSRFKCVLLAFRTTRPSSFYINLNLNSHIKKLSFVNYRKKLYVSVKFYPVLMVFFLIYFILLNIFESKFQHAVKLFRTKWRPERLLVCFGVFLNAPQPSLHSPLNLRYRVMKRTHISAQLNLFRQHLKYVVSSDMKGHLSFSSFVSEEKKVRAVLKALRCCWQEACAKKFTEC